VKTSDNKDTEKKSNKQGRLTDYWKNNSMNSTFPEQTPAGKQKKNKNQRQRRKRRKAEEQKLELEKEKNKKTDDLRKKLEWDFSNMQSSTPAIIRKDLSPTQEADRILKLLRKNDEEEKEEEQVELRQNEPTLPGIKKIIPRPQLDKPIMEMNCQELLDAMSYRMEESIFGVEEKMKEMVKDEVAPIKEAVANVMGTEIVNIHNKIDLKAQETDAKISDIIEKDEKTQRDIKGLEQQKVQIQNEIKELELNKASISRELADFRNSMDLYNQKYEEYKLGSETTERKLREKIGQLEEMLTKSKEWENTVTCNSEDIINGDRKWRRQNLRINNLDDYKQGESLEQTVARFIFNYKLTYTPCTLLECLQEIDYAFRFGNTEKNQTR
jgi:hypothetical protein